MAISVDVRCVVAATDRSEGGDRAAKWGAGIRPDGARLVLVQVLPADTSKDEQIGADEQLGALARELAGDAGAGRVVTDDAIADAIVGVARDEGADVLVVGNHGMRGRREFLLGNVANRITHAAECTTVVVQSTDGASPQPTPVAGGDPRRAARAREILGVLSRHGILDLLRDPGSGAASSANARKLRAALEELGPTFSKLGQILSTRPDLLPSEWIDELASLQADVPPMSEPEVVAVMEAELGVPWEDVFESIEPEPLAAGTIGQVHRATLTGGDRVVVKVQRPNAADVIRRDLALLASLVRGARLSARLRRVVDLEALVADLGESLTTELDFRREAEHLDSMAVALEGFDRLDVPRCRHELSSGRLLVIDEVVDGVALDAAPAGTARTEAARQLVASFFDQVLTRGFFHADPHPGNLLWSDGRVWLLDLGMVGTIDEATRRQLLLVLLAFSQRDASFLTDLVLGMTGATIGEVDADGLGSGLETLIDSVHGASLGEIEIGPLLQQITDLAVRHRAPIPTELALVGKALAQVQLSVASLDPDLDLFEEARRFFVRDLVRRVAGHGNPGRLLYEAEKVRFRLSTVADALTTAAGGRPGRRLEIGFSSERLERTVARAGRAVAFGFAGGLALLGSVIATGSERTPPWAGRVLGAVGTGLTVAAVGEAGRRPLR